MAVEGCVCVTAGILEGYYESHYGVARINVVYPAPFRRPWNRCSVYMLKIRIAQQLDDGPLRVLAL
eukprot:COSAG02_NODE_3769_length_6263_cov_3.234426_2_plen_66_part_00